MKLVKDLYDSDIVFYWTGDSGEKLSPNLHTLMEAEEWWKREMFARYEGPERRKSIYDRREDSETRKRFERNHKFSRHNPQGRRQTDQPVKVDIDLAKEKIEQIMVWRVASNEND
ncbi:hypothetical protein [Neptuniibacter halophilus]|uniref:hypothetical protein n=1 Tax=Neptuniibacter halophilus TaxID=651666 RepID=UPI002574205F|nr:hypothetical protein [Neptuniibacter halophilus]